MKAMIPDKIYVGINDLGSGYSVDISLSPEERHSEYIRKNALMEWLNKMLKSTAESFRFSENQAYGKVIDKINSL